MFCNYMATLVTDSHPTCIPKSDIVLLLLGIKSDCSTNQYQNLQFSCHSELSTNPIFSEGFGASALRLQIYALCCLYGCITYRVTHSAMTKVIRLC